MRFNTLFFLLILSGLCLALAQVSYDDCCLKYVSSLTKGTQKHALQYREQKADGGCNIPAIIFKMRKGRMICANPKATWVIELMKRIDNKKPHNKHHPQGQKS